MKIETRKRGAFCDLVLIAENNDESNLIDTRFGNKVGKNDFIANVKGEVRLGDGYREHYILLKGQS